MKAKRSTSGSTQFLNQSAFLPPIPEISVKCSFSGSDYEENDHSVRSTIPLLQRPHFQQSWIIIPPENLHHLRTLNFAAFTASTSTKVNLTLHQYECPCRHRL
jgi:hypothetical protein